ncbi:hypothetical protein BKA62DRAFT_624260, partial [Auriculariales sp. MPI-PUGE-AT-0066]
GALFPLLNSEQLGNIGISTISQCLSTLKAIHHLKLMYNIPTGREQRGPFSSGNDEVLSLKQLTDIIREQGQRLRMLEDENRLVLGRLKSLEVQTRITENIKPQPASVALKHTTKYPSQDSSDTSTIASPSLLAQTSPPLSEILPTESSSSPNDKIKVSREDPTWKVLPAALKKHNIHAEDAWGKYTMLISYGNTERYMAYNDQPLAMFEKLQKAGRRPVFMLRHIKDVPSPIAMAMQRAQRREATNEAYSNVRAKQRHPVTRNRFPPPDARQSLVTRSPAELVEPRAQDDASLSPSFSTIGPLTTPGAAFHTKPAYAVAIYPHTAEQEQELDVEVGDCFILLNRTDVWWSVQRDATGMGDVNEENGEIGWVLAGCLLEISMPVSQAFFEALRTKASQAVLAVNASRRPILPQSINSANFLGVAMADHHTNVHDELELNKGDLVLVFKRYKHWLYVVKKPSGDRGWVPVRKSLFMGLRVTSYAAGVVHY